MGGTSAPELQVSCACRRIMYPLFPNLAQWCGSMIQMVRSVSSQLGMSNWVTALRQLVSERRDEEDIRVDGIKCASISRWSSLPLE